MPENDTLKGKRRLTRSIITRVRSKFNVAVAEVDDQDLRRVVTIGFSSVSNDTTHVNEMLSRIVQYVEQCRLDAELLDYEIEILDVL